MDKNYDFSGWVTKNNLKCSDGRIIHADAFKENDGCIVPLVWNHDHDDPDNILGNVLLENREGGVYGYGSFNDNEKAQSAKMSVKHGDIKSMSIFATQLKQKGAEVIHGAIKEVSLVLAGANPGARIENVLMHSDDSDEGFVETNEAFISSGEELVLEHACNSTNSEKKVTDETEEKKPEKKVEHSDKTVEQIFNELTEEQKNVVYAMLGKALEENDNPTNEEEGDNKMKHNVFDKNEEKEGEVLSHSEVSAILADAKRDGSLKNAVLQHEVSDDTLSHTVTDAGGNTVSYGIANIDYLFPDARTATPTPDFISRDMEWVSKVVSAAKHLPFSRVKSVHANITMDEARAKGYTKGNEKDNEVFSLLKRTTSPTTIYKKQKLDRDDIVDITDFDVVAWLKVEMRMLLDEEIARAALIGDGRVAGSDDKISEENIRPIWKDVDTYTVKVPVTVAANATDDDKAKAFIRKAIKARKDYKGSGNPVMFTTEDCLTDCLLLEDGNGRVIYETMDKLKTALRVKDIITVPVLENQTRVGSGDDAGFTFTLMALIVNMADYSFGADKGGSVNMFDDFDIDFNQQKYLIETRCSGALTRYHSALAIESKSAS